MIGCGHLQPTTEISTHFQQNTCMKPRHPTHSNQMSEHLVRELSVCEHVTVAPLEHLWICQRGLLHQCSFGIAASNIYPRECLFEIQNSGIRSLAAALARDFQGFARSPSIMMLRTDGADGGGASTCRKHDDGVALGVEMQRAAIKRKKMHDSMMSRKAKSAPARTRDSFTEPPPLSLDAPADAPTTQRTAQIPQTPAVPLSLDTPAVPTTPRTAQPPLDQFPRTPSPGPSWHTPSVHAHYGWHPGCHAEAVRNAQPNWHMPALHAHCGWLHSHHAAAMVRPSPALFWQSSVQTPTQPQESHLMPKAQEATEMGKDVRRANGCENKNGRRVQSSATEY